MTTAARSRSAARTLAAFAAACAVSGCGSGVLDPQGPVGTAERVILFNSLAIMLAIVIPTIVATLAFAWWFRASNSRARYRPTFVYSGRIELIVWSIPTLVILFLGGVIWIGSHELDPARALESEKKPLDVQAVSLDWKWLFIYPEQGVASVNQLVLPAGTPVQFAITSASVFNVFFVPQLGSMIYAMSGMTTRLHLQADREGELHGLSAHYSGDGFSRMQFKVSVVADAAFDAWIAATRSSGPILNRDAYTALSRQSLDVPPSTFRAVEPHLFDAVASQELAPGPGPEIGRPEPDVSPRPRG